MKDKYWAFILIGIILLGSLAVFFTYGNAIEKSSKIGYDNGYKIGYNNKICEICDEKICACACPQPNADKLCKDRIHIMCIGYWEIINDKCYWNCEAR